MKNKKGFLQMSFAWLFAIIVGAFILFLAIYASTKIVNTEQTSLDAQAAKEIGVLLNPLETGFETGKTTSLRLPSETRIYNRCNNNGVFGRQIIQISQKSFNEWSDTDVNVGFSNKHIFSEDYVEGKKFFIFSKPFNFPFKVADLIFLTSSEERYCFVNPPEDIDRELSNLKQENLVRNICSEGDIKVCFSPGSDCDIQVNEDSRYVEKDGGRMDFYEDALMYAAIFSDKNVYECQLKRVMQRGEQLALLYQDKANLISREGCNTNLNQELSSLGSLEDSFEGSSNLNNYMVNLVEDVEKRNNLAECKLW
tara:strand:- start:445 stop:1374 length:930 start_codon:yes stop_codon:yes gene_type:complete